MKAPEIATPYPLRFAVSVSLVAALFTGPTRANPSGGVSLLKTLSEWKYPDSKMLGATMSDGGNPLIQSVKCQSILTTPDPIEKVIAFYSKLVEPSPPDRQREGPEDKVGPAHASSVSTQDDSGDRPVTIRVIVVNRADSATTIVISRAEGEKETHIAWVHYLRFDVKP